MYVNTSGITTGSGALAVDGWAVTFGTRCIKKAPERVSTPLSAIHSHVANGKAVTVRKVYVGEILNKFCCSSKMV